MIRARASKANTQKWYNSTSALLNNVLPALYHDFAKQRYYDSALGETALPYTTTIRSSNAMQFDANGNLVWAPANMCTRSQDFSTGWSMGADGSAVLSGSTAPTGSPSYTITWTTPSPTSGCAITAQPSVVGANMTYSVYLRYVNHQWARVYMYSNAAAGNGIVAYVDLIGKTIGTNGPSGTGTSYIGGSVTDVGNGWVRVTVSGNPNATTASDIGLLVTTAASNGSGTRVGNGAAIEAASVVLQMHDSSAPASWRSEFVTAGSAWYGPRFDYDPITHEPLGVLIEDQRTNDITTSFMLSGTTGVFQAGTGSNGPQYLGGWPSARYTGDGTNTGHFFYTGSVTPGASTTRSVSAVVGYVDTQYLQLATSANWPLDAANTYMNIDATTGAITATGSAVTAPFSVKLAENVYHIGFTCVTAAVPTNGAASIVGAVPTSTSGRLSSSTHSASFDVIYLGNCLGAGWNSITPSYTAASTRAQDNYRMTTGSWLNTSRGTIYAEARKVTVVGGAYTFTNIGNDSGSSERNQFRISSTNTSHIITVTGVVQATTAIGTTVPVGSNFKAAYRYAIGAQNLFEDGSVGTAGNIAALPAVQDTLHTGELGSASEKFNGWIKELRYYNNASASNAQIQTITT